MQETDNHQLNKYEQGDTDWTHSTDMQTIEERLVIRDADSNLGNYTPHSGATFIATDTGAVYDGDGSSWNAATRDVDELTAQSVTTDEGVIRELQSLPGDLSRGLVGEWVFNGGNRVTDRSGHGNDIYVGRQARWIWFTEPRAIYDSAAGHTVVGINNGGDTELVAYDDGDNTLDTTTLATEVSNDNHVHPSILKRSDGVYVVFWSGHNGDQVNWRIASSANSIGSFGSTKSFTGDSVTYPNPRQLTDETDSPIYLIYRDRQGTGDGHVVWRQSTDGGSTFGAAQRVVTAPNGHYSMYFKVVEDGGDKLHFFFTDAHGTQSNPHRDILYCYYQGGSFYQADGTLIMDEGSLPMTKSDLEVVYDSSVSGNHDAWVHDVEVKNGNPVCAFATFPATYDHEYWYAKHDGSWTVSKICDAGSNAAGDIREEYYSGGVALSDDPDTVYATQIDDASGKLVKLTTDDGESWISEGVVEDLTGTGLIPWLPIVPRNHSEMAPVLWTTVGHYVNHSRHPSVLGGLPKTSPSGGIFACDGHQVGAFGGNRFSNRHFIDGITVTTKAQANDPTRSQNVLSWEGAIKIAYDSGNVQFSLYDGSATKTVQTPIDDTEHVVTGTWVPGGSEMTLYVDGTPMASEPFDGPISLESLNRPWTFFSDWGAVSGGFGGDEKVIQLHRRGVSDAEAAEVYNLLR